MRSYETGWGTKWEKCTRMSQINTASLFLINYLKNKLKYVYSYELSILFKK